MARISQTVPCPACGEPMKVARSKAAQKVCCPHCRQNVVLESRTDAALEIPSEFHATLENAGEAVGNLEKLLVQSREKRELLDTTSREIAAIEMQVRSLSNWLQAQKTTPEDVLSKRMLATLQSRLYEQLISLPKGRISVVDCDPQTDGSLGHSLRLTFEAHGWEVLLNHSDESPRCGEEITFIVPPGPVSYSVAAIYMALQCAGIRLHSLIDPDQPHDSAVLRAHRVFTIPKVLPAPEIRVSEKSPSNLKRTA